MKNERISALPQRCDHALFGLSNLADPPHACPFCLHVIFALQYKSPRFGLLSLRIPLTPSRGRLPCLFGQDGDLDLALLDEKHRVGVFTLAEDLFWFLPYRSMVLPRRSRPEKQGSNAFLI